MPESPVPPHDSAPPPSIFGPPAPPPIFGPPAPTDFDTWCRHGVRDFESYMPAELRNGWINWLTGLIKSSRPFRYRKGRRLIGF